MQVTLTTTGRKTGEPRTIPLYAWEDGVSLLLVGSWGGRSRDPSWVRNLRADPHAAITRGRVTTDYVARELDGAERDRAWRIVVEAFPLYASYQRRTERRIPLFALTVKASPERT